MDKSTHEIRLAQWKDIIEQCQSRPDGMTAKQWLAEKEIPEKTYYYWLRKIRKQAFEQINGKSLPTVSATSEMAFVEMPFSPEERQPASLAQITLSSPSPDAVIRTHCMEIGLYNSASDMLIARIMKELRHAV